MMHCKKWLPAALILGLAVLGAPFKANAILMVETTTGGISTIFVDQNPAPLVVGGTGDPDGSQYYTIGSPLNSFPGDVVFDTDTIGLDASPIPGLISISPAVIGGLLVFGSTHTSNFALANGLTSGSSTVINTTAAAITSTVVISDVNFVGGPGGVRVDSAFSGTIENGSFSATTWDDPGNRIFGNKDPNDPDHFSATAIQHGSLVLPFSAGAQSLASNPPQVILPITGPFSKTIVFTTTLNPGGSLIGRGITIQNFALVAVPEPATMAMAFSALPLLGLGYYVRRRRTA